MNGTRKTLITIVALLLVTCVIRAQDIVKTLTVDVDIVLIPTTVTNDRGQYISGLEKKHFQIFEDKVEQEVVYFSTEDAPMSLGIVLDASGGMNPIMDPARRNSGACLNM